ncbi:456_t:CDS:2 [Ambispora leptoticha]|uniref:456_t:CDS:1 n=1 Tax=Ambispora leptoticha TaxID=144679 RepID=A0A9N8WB27_9GLOM|nr:456_t:CDS:2 [Ambispora leptoticha]
MEKQAVIEVKNVNKIYGGKRVLKNVSFEVKPGIHGFIGPNGAGKTTTLGIIVRLLVAKDPSFNEHLGFVPAEPLFPPITVETYVLDCGYLRDIPQEEVLAKLNSSPLAAHKNKKCHELSTDEPFNGLDPTFRKDLFDNLIHIKKQGGTILISTHILSDLQKLADEITMIRDGEIVYSGPKTDDIEKTYEDYFVKQKKGILLTGLANRENHSRENKENLLSLHKLVYQGYFLKSEETIKQMKEYYIDKSGYSPKREKKARKDLEKGFNFIFGDLFENLGLPFRTPYDYNLVEFASPRGWKELSTYQM